MNAHVRTYGRCAVAGGEIMLMDLEPHVSIAAKRLFPRLPAGRARDFTIAETSANCSDVLWFMARYPLRIEKPSLARLKAGHRDGEKQKELAAAVLRTDWTPGALPAFKGGMKPYRYQAQAAELGSMRRGLLLGDDVGLGKTVSAFALIARTGKVPAAVIVEAHLAEQWADDAAAEFTNFRTHIIKGTTPYDLPDADLYVFKYSNIAGWVDVAAEIKFKTVVFDEIQQLRTGAVSAKYRAAETFASHAESVLGLSATPIYNYGGEIYDILHVVEPGLLGSRLEFYLEWCIAKGNGKYLVREPDALGAHLRDTGVFLRRTESDVDKELPPVNTLTHWVDYDHALAESSIEEARSLAMKVLHSKSFNERGQAARELDMMARHATGVAKAASVAAFARILAADEPLILAGYHRDVYDIWLRLLGDLNPLMYTGTETSATKRRARETFLAGDSRILILSLRSGAGLDGLQKVCRRVVLGEIDWSPQIHKQIIGRLRRPGQRQQVDAIYCLTNEGSDPPMVEMLGLKAGQARGITDPFTGSETVESDDSRIKALARHYLGGAK